LQRLFPLVVGVAHDDVTVAVDGDTARGAVKLLIAAAFAAENLDAMIGHAINYNVAFRVNTTFAASANCNAVATQTLAHACSLTFENVFSLLNKIPGWLNNCNVTT
jgi:hypothetical protein